MAKIRLDVLLTQQNLFPSREAARRAIMAGQVRRHSEVVDKPGTFVNPDEKFEVVLPNHGYVGRGGLKLERALQSFEVDLDGRIVVDVGASTGGFTDCALQHGAKRVFAVDVGYGQLDWKLRTDTRVTVMERTNFRHADTALFVPQPDIAVMDVSFISTRLLFPKLQEVLACPKDILSLVKPQFEAGRANVGKGGIVRDPLVHREVLLGLLRFVYENGFVCRGLDYSPISGGDGNIEYLAWWQGCGSEQAEPVLQAELIQQVDAVVVHAWRELKGEFVEDILLRSHASEQP